jgi:hypothetical protein
MNKSVTHLITTEKEFEEETSKVTKAKELGLIIVSEDFLHESINAKKPLDVEKFSLEEEVRKAYEERQSNKRKRGDDDDDEGDDSDEEEGEEQPSKRRKFSDEPVVPIPEFTRLPADTQHHIYSFLDLETIFGSLMLAAKMFYEDPYLSSPEFLTLLIHSLYHVSKRSDVSSRQTLTDREIEAQGEEEYHIRYGTEKSKELNRLALTLFDDSLKKKFNKKPIVIKNPTEEFKVRFLLKKFMTRKMKTKRIETMDEDDESEFIPKFNRMLKTIKNFEQLTLGAWPNDDYTVNYLSKLTDLLIKNADKLQNLKAIYFADIMDEQVLSNINILTL